MSENKATQLQEQRQIDHFRWNVKAIALPCPREFIYRDDSRARLVQRQDMLIFFENGMMDVMLPEQLQTHFQSELSCDPNLLIYSKTSEVKVQKIDDNFVASRGNYYTRGEVGDYLVEDTVFPFHQFALKETQFKILVKRMNEFFDDKEDEDEEDKDDEINRSQSLELQSMESKEEYLAPPLSSPQVATAQVDAIPESVHRDYLMEYLNNRHKLPLKKELSKRTMISESVQNVDISVETFLPEEIAQVTKFVNYENFSEVSSYSWNLKNHSYLAIRVTDEKLSIEFPDHPIICRSQRYTGVRGDYLIFNTSGYFFAVVSPSEFEMLFESEPYRGNILLIRRMKNMEILSLQLGRLASAFWNRTVEYGKSGDHLVQLSVGSFVFQWILSKTEFLELFDPYHRNEIVTSRSESVGDRAECSWNGIETVIGPSFANPFNLFDANAPCWKGFLRRFIRNGKKYHLQWKPIYAEIYPDQIIWNPLSKNPRRCFMFNCTSVKNHNILGTDCIIVDGILIAELKKKKPTSASTEKEPTSTSREIIRSVSSTFHSLVKRLPSNDSATNLIETAEYFTIYQGDGSDIPSSIVPEDFTFTDYLSSDFSRITLQEMTELFRACRSWSKRKLLCERIIQPSENTIPKGSFVHMFSDVLKELPPEEWTHILTSPVDKMFGQETIAHIAIQCNNDAVIRALFGPSCQSTLLCTEYHTTLSRRSYAACVKDPTVLSIIKTPEEFYSASDSEGNTLLMLLISQGSYTVVSSLLTDPRFSRTQFSTEYLNTQNVQQESLLSLSLHLLLSPAANCHGADIKLFFQTLLNRNCDPNLRNSEGNTCLHFLCFMFNSLPSDDESLRSKFLIAEVIADFAPRSDVSATNDAKETPLSLFVRMKDDLAALSIDNQTVNLLSIIDLLVGPPPATDMGIINPTFGPCPLLICAECGLSSLFDHLISKGAEFSLKNEDSGETSLDIISRRMQELTQRLFLTASDRRTLEGLNKCYDLLMAAITAKTSSTAADVKMEEPETGTSGSPKGIIFQRNLEIQSGQISALVRYLSSHEPFSEVDARALVFGYPSLCSHEEFFQILVSESLSSTDVIAPPVIPSSVGLLRLLFVWTLQRRSDAESLFAQSEYLSLFSRFITDILANSQHGFDQEVITLLSSQDPQQIISGILRFGPSVRCARPVSLNQRIQTLTEENSRKIELLFQSSKAPLTRPKQFVSFNPEEMVRQISLTMQYLFKQIPSQELLSSHYGNCKHIQKLRKFKDRLQSYFINEILRYSSLQDRVETIHYLLRCLIYADTLYSNFELIEVIYLSLTTPPVYRLTETFQAVQSQYPKELEHFQRLTSGCCRLLHDYMKQCTPPAIPYIGYYAKVMQRCTVPPKVTASTPPDENKEAEAERDGEGEEMKQHLNLQYFKIQAQHVMDLEKFQSVPYLFQFNEEIQRDVVNCRHYLDDAATLDQRSLQLQPRAAVAK